MELRELKQHAWHDENFEIRVVSHAGSRCYLVELENGRGEGHLLLLRGKPMLFRSLDGVYLELKRAGIHRAYLVQFVANDEMIGREPHYREPLSSRIPLVF